jgi:hypothetical protein
MPSTALIVLCAALPLGDAEFIRGDANSDGAVSISDGHYILSYLFRGSREPECMDAADYDDDQKINITDGVKALDHAVSGDSPPPAPFAALGADPTDDRFDCKSYGSGAPLEDPEAVLEILEAAVDPADASRARITLAVSCSTRAAGFSGRLSLSPSAAAGVERHPRDLSGTMEFGYRYAVIDGDAIRFGFVSSMTEMRFLSPGRSMEAIELTVCLAEGLSPGEYAVVLEEGELIDFDSGRAILPRLVSSKLTVTGVVPGGPDCNPEVPPPERIPVNAVFKLGDVVVPPGGSVTVPFVIRADQDIQAYAFSVDFDETLLDAGTVEPVWRRSEGDPEYGFSAFHLNNANEVPGSAGVDEGYMIGAVIFSLTEHVVMPRDTDNIALRFHMNVAPDAPDGTTTIRFLDGGTIPGSPPVENFMTATGREVFPSVAESFLLVDCLLQILPDGALFVRGDSNRDGRINVSDPVNTLGHLFLGAGPLDCSDAADADDGGSVELADIIVTLEHLFLGGPPLPPPFASEGNDPTPDALSCFLRP